MQELNSLIKKYEKNIFSKANLINDLNAIPELKIDKDENNQIFFSIRKSNYWIEYENRNGFITITNFDSFAQVLPLSKL
jgi:hypothetical protein